MTANQDARYQHVFITGASSGIGRSLAVKFALKSNKLTLQGRNKQGLDETAAQASAVNPDLKINILPGDLTVTHDRENMIRQFETSDLDGVVLNAGGGAFGEFIKSDWQTQKQVIELNIEAPTHLTHALLPKLLKTATNTNRKSALIIISSHAAFIRTPLFAVYGACKAYLNYFLLTLKQELYKSPIDFLVVCPGATKTQFSTRAGLPSKMLSTPKSPDEVAELTIAHIGRTSMLIVATFDKIIYWAMRLLPAWFFDFVVKKLQERLLKRSGK